MIKLARNIFVDRHVLICSEGQIQGEYIYKFQMLQESTKFKLANKLGENHINFRNQKMKVRISIYEFYFVTSVKYCL